MLLARQIADRLAAEAKAKDLQHERKFTELLRTSESKMTDDFKLRSDTSHEQIRKDYAMELQNQKDIMEEQTRKQQELIVSQADRLRNMKDRFNKLKTVNLDNQDAVKEELDALEEKYYEAERRCQDYETKVWHLQQERNLKSNVAPPTDHDDEADYVDPNDFSDGPYRGDDEEEEEEEDVPGVLRLVGV